MNKLYILGGIDQISDDYSTHKDFLEFNIKTRFWQDLSLEENGIQKYQYASRTTSSTAVSTSKSGLTLNVYIIGGHEVKHDTPNDSITEISLRSNKINWWLLHFIDNTKLTDLIRIDNF